MEAWEKTDRTKKEDKQKPTESYFTCKQVKMWLNPTEEVRESTVNLSL